MKLYLPMGKDQISCNSNGHHTIFLKFIYLRQTDVCYEVKCKGLEVCNNLIYTTFMAQSSYTLFVIHVVCVLSLHTQSVLLPHTCLLLQYIVYYISNSKVPKRTELQFNILTPFAQASFPVLLFDGFNILRLVSFKGRQAYVCTGVTFFKISIEGLHCLS